LCPISGDRRRKKSGSFNGARESCSIWRVKDHPCFRSIDTFGSTTNRVHHNSCPSGHCLDRHNPKVLDWGKHVDKATLIKGVKKRVARSRDEGNGDTSFGGHLPEPGSVGARTREDDGHVY